MATKRCTDATRGGRLAKARQFLAAAELIETASDDEADVIDAYITLCIHAGIAAGDVICCARLGSHAQGDNHNEAIALLKKASATYATQLGVLLGLKTKSGYSATASSTADRKRAGRAARRLVEAAEAL